MAFWNASLSAAAGAACLWLLGRAFRALAESTLLGAWCWAVLAVVIVAIVEVASGWPATWNNSHGEMLRFASGALLFCPTMALLGARRPQNTAWQFVVLTLWGVITWPVFELWVRGRGEPLSLDPVRSCFLVVLIVLGIANHLPTRFSLAAAALGAAQSLLVWPQLPWTAIGAWRPPPIVALVFLLVALIECTRAARFSKRQPLAAPDPARAAIELVRWQTVWFDFRDWFGVVWSMRVMERFNATAILNCWPVHLQWDGLRVSPDSPGGANRRMTLQASDRANQVKVDPLMSGLTAQHVAAIDQVLHSLLWRFVSRQWIDKRLASVSRLPETGLGTAATPPAP